MAEARVRLGFRNASDQQIAAIAAGVLEGMTGNPAFPDPPVDMMTLQTVMNEFNDAIAARAQRGRIGTAHKNKIRDKLMRRLRQVAHYVEMKCDNNRAVLLSSGFPAKNPSRARTPCPKAVILSIDNGHTTQLCLHVQAIPNARCYELQSAEVGSNGMGPWQDCGKFTNSRLMRVNGLTPGTTYAFQVRAVGGSTRYGDWSDPVSHMCI
ncbi:MAG: hypothetical protein DMG11_23880 [Acidobacteria bacterium]|nr:MAG: hypothetical protein DMG11_23880 [Acidobacteriota bacterium]